ncbi:hypothetical protein E8E12_005541, partial [Didymella heteroderae]
HVVYALREARWWTSSPSTRRKMNTNQPTEGEKSKLSRLSWGNTANKLKRRSLY